MSTSSDSDVVTALRQQVETRNKRILNLERMVADLRDELTEAEDVHSDGLSPGAAEDVRRVHRMICEGRVDEAVREMQSAFPDMGLRDRETERRLIHPSLLVV